MNCATSDMYAHHIAVCTLDQILYNINNRVDILMFQLSYYS